MTKEQTKKLREILQKVPLELLRAEIKRRQAAATVKVCRMCDRCKALKKRVQDCLACYQIKKDTCRNRHRLNVGIPLDAPMQTKGRKKIVK